jgi:CRP/FNR family transcriptional regulator, cyclic AMP receptor protein
VILRSSIPASRLLPAARTSNRPYEVTAEMIEPRQANFITRDALLHFLREHGEVALRAAEQLSLNYYSAHDGIRILGLSNSPSERFAKLLSKWSNAPTNADPLQVKTTLTHEEIAEIIGTTRETVSRLFSQYKKKLLQLKGATLVIRNQAAPEKMVNS